MVKYELIQVQYAGGKDSIPNASVRVKRPDGSEVTEAAISGNGPVDAVLKAIQRALGTSMELADFSIKSTGLGSEATGRVSMSITDNGAKHGGSALGTDIVVASGEAFINALNAKAEFEATVVAHTV